LHYIVSRRKKGKWETFNGDHEPQPPLPQGIASDDEWACLVEAYDAVLAAQGLGSDNVAYDDDLADCLSQTFAELTGRIIPGRVLFAAIMNRRKRGEWPTLPKEKEGGLGFNDIDQVAS